MRVPPKLMAHARDGARTFGKSDPIDALAVARAALQGARPAAPTSTAAAILLSTTAKIVQERTRIINRLRWHRRRPPEQPPGSSTTANRQCGPSPAAGTVADRTRARTLRLTRDQTARARDHLAPPIRSVVRLPRQNRRRDRRYHVPSNASLATRHRPCPLVLQPPRHRSADATANSTPPSTASRSPKPNGTPTPTPVVAGDGGPEGLRIPPRPRRPPPAKILRAGPAWGPAAETRIPELKRGFPATGAYPER